MTSDNTPQPAATVLVLRDGPEGPEIFMVRRHEASGAFRGAHVFPGGRVEAEDAADESWCDGVDHAEQQLPNLPTAEAGAFHVAAVRELFEEAGILLARDNAGTIISLTETADQERFAQYRLDVHAHQRRLRDITAREGLRLALDALTLCAHWVTPPVEGRRFDTRFFVARMPPFQAPAHDQTETTESGWVTAAAALAAAARRAVVLPPPTWTTLRELEHFELVDEVIAWSRHRSIDRREPKLVHENGTRMLVMPDENTRFIWTDGYWRPEGRGKT